MKKRFLFGKFLVFGTSILLIAMFIFLMTGLQVDADDESGMVSSPKNIEVLDITKLDTSNATEDEQNIVINNDLFDLNYDKETNTLTINDNGLISYRNLLGYGKWIGLLVELNKKVDGSEGVYTITPKDYIDAIKWGSGNNNTLLMWIDETSNGNKITFVKENKRQAEAIGNMSYVGEGIARQPEAYTGIMEFTEKVMSDILNTDSGKSVALGIMADLGVEGIARQPEAKEQITQAYDTIKEYIMMSDDTQAEGIGIMGAQALEGIARQPGASDKIVEMAEIVAQCILNTTGHGLGKVDIGTEILDFENVGGQSMGLGTVGGQAVEGIARQPEAYNKIKDTFNLVCEYILSGDEYQGIGLGTVGGQAVEGIARQPEAYDKIVSQLRSSAQCILSASGWQAMGLGTAGGQAVEGIARQPEAYNKIGDAFDMVCEYILSGDEYQGIGLGTLGGQAVEGIARQPEAYDKIVSQLRSSAQCILNATGRGAVGLGVAGGQAVEGIARQPDASNKIGDAFDITCEYVLSGNEYQGEGIGTLGGMAVEGIARQPEAYDKIVSQLRTSAQCILNATGRGAVGLGVAGGQAVEGIARQPDASNKIGDAFDITCEYVLSGNEYQGEGIGTLGGQAVEGIARQPEAYNKIISQLRTSAQCILNATGRGAVGLGVVGGQAVEGIARQPEASNMIGDAFDMVCEYALSGDEYQGEGIGTLGGMLVEGIARQPEAYNLLVEYAELVINDILNTNGEKSLALSNLGTLSVEGIARQPEAKELITQAYNIMKEKILISNHTDKLDVNIMFNAVYTITFDSKGGTYVDSIMQPYGTPVIVPANPTKTGYDFVGWDVDIPEVMPAEDITITAIWTTKGWSSGGGSTRGSSNLVEDENISKNDDNEGTQDNVIQDMNDGIVDNDENNGNIQDKNVDKENEMNKIINNKLDDLGKGESSLEMEKAYEFAYNNGITTKSTIKEAKMNRKLTRIEMAKMLSYYAINVMGKIPDTTKNVKFRDVTKKMDERYDNGVTLAYQLGIMGQNMPRNRFRPNDEVSRAEFVTALSRMLYQTSDGEYEKTARYYMPHMAKLYNEGIVNDTNPGMKERRGYVMIMLMRAVK